MAKQATESFSTLHYPLSIVDKLILRSYEPVLDMLSHFLGKQCEVVLHSLEDLQHSVIKIVNSHLTGRTVGAPITDTALRMLKQLKEQETFVSQAYFTHTKSGKKMRSITQAIKGENERIIGLLCVNFNLDAPLNEVMSFWLTSFDQNQPLIPSQHSNEHFAENIEDLFNQTVKNVVEKIEQDPNISTSNKNKFIIVELYQQGFFELKGAIKHLANVLGISTHTVYMHLRNFNKNGGSS